MRAGFLNLAEAYEALAEQTKADGIAWNDTAPVRFDYCGFVVSVGRGRLWLPARASRCWPYLSNRYLVVFVGHRPISTSMCRWRISILGKTPAIPLGHVRAPDEETAPERAIEFYSIPDNQHFKVIAVKVEEP
jgi:hypothetical protein